MIFKDPVASLLSFYECVHVHEERGQGRQLSLSLPILLFATGSPGEFRVYQLASWPASELQEYPCLHPDSKCCSDKLASTPGSV